MIKHSLIILIQIIFINLSSAQVITNRIHSFFNELETLGDSPLSCEGQFDIEQVNLGQAYKTIKLNCDPPKETIQYQGHPISVLTPEEAQSLMLQFQQIEYLPMKYLEDGCYARSHELTLIAKENGIELGKAFLLPPEGSGDLLYPHHLKDSGTFFRDFSGWKYHTAPFVLVRNGDKVEPMIFDLGVSPRIQSFDEWNQSMSSTPERNQIQTRHRSFIYHDLNYRLENESIIEGLKETQDLIDEIGYDEYSFRLERGWL